MQVGATALSSSCLCIIGMPRDDSVDGFLNDLSEIQVVYLGIQLTVRAALSVCMCADCRHSSELTDF